MKIEISAFGAKIVKSIALIFGLCSLCAQGAGFSGAPYAQLDLDENPIVVTNVTFDGLVTDVVSMTWVELKSLRDGSGLKSGQQYRITDYIATTIQEYTQSANHRFDIIVTADSTNKLNEVARAIRHEGDTYFPETTKFEAWKIWYSLDNNTNRFEWADSANGKGVIYRMIDEFNNDVPYDFKGILSREWHFDPPTYCYVFCAYEYDFNYDLVERNDTSLYGVCRNNKIPQMIEGGVQKINNIHILGSNGGSNNTFGENCGNISLGNRCSNNTFGKNCFETKIDESSSFNMFGNDCARNYLGKSCTSNTFGTSCYENNLGSNIVRCSIGSGSSENRFPDYCRALTLQNDVRGMTLVLPQGTVYYRNVEFKSGLRNVVIEDTRDDNTYKNKIFRPKDSVVVSVVSP